MSEEVEPDAVIEPSSGGDLVASIAISLKRIADAVTYDEEGHNNLFDYVRWIAEGK